MKLSRTKEHHFAWLAAIPLLDVTFLLIFFLLLSFALVAQLSFKAVTAKAVCANRRCPPTVFLAAHLANSHGYPALTRTS